MPFLRNIEITIKEIPWTASRSIGAFTNPDALAFYQKMTSSGYEAEELIKVLPRHKVIYVTIPKAASTRIRSTLARVEGKLSRSLKPSKRARYRGPYGPRNVTIGSFHKLATNPATLRFSFVRNPYARAVSCWADKFATKPLVKGDYFIDSYLAARHEIDPRLPRGRSHTLSFADFVVYVAAIANAREDSHLRAQYDILQIPGIKLNFIGKVESFSSDFAFILDYLNADRDVCREATVAANKSYHSNWNTYYTADLADLIYRAYEQDFDHFGYPRALVSGRNQMSARGPSWTFREDTSLLIDSVGSIFAPDANRGRGEMS